MTTQSKTEKPQAQKVSTPPKGFVRAEVLFDDEIFTGLNPSEGKRYFHAGDVIDMPVETFKAHDEYRRVRRVNTELKVQTDEEIEQRDAALAEIEAED